MSLDSTKDINGEIGDEAIAFEKFSEILSKAQGMVSLEDCREHEKLEILNLFNDTNKAICKLNSKIIDVAKRIDAEQGKKVIVPDKKIIVAGVY